MDAPEYARTIERIERLRFAVMYPACLRGPVTAGLDGIRLSEGRRRDAQSSYRAVCSDNTSGWISPGYLFRHHVLFTLAMPLAFPYRNTAWKSCCLLSMAQTVRAVLLAMATRTTLVGRLASNSPIQGEGFWGAPRCQRSTARDP